MTQTVIPQLGITDAATSRRRKRNLPEERV